MSCEAFSTMTNESFTEVTNGSLEMLQVQCTQWYVQIQQQGSKFYTVHQLYKKCNHKANS